MIYRITYWNNPLQVGTGEWAITSSFDAHDVQWKDYGARATNDVTGEKFIFPYSSIQYVQILEDADI